MGYHAYLSAAWYFGVLAS